jgi:hypothetical protein
MVTDTRHTHGSHLEPRRRDAGKGVLQVPGKVHDLLQLCKGGHLVNTTVPASPCCRCSRRAARHRSTYASRKCTAHRDLQPPLCWGPERAPPTVVMTPKVAPPSGVRKLAARAVWLRAVMEKYESKLYRRLGLGPYAWALVLRAPNKPATCQGVREAGGGSGRGRGVGSGRGRVVGTPDTAAAAPDTTGRHTGAGARLGPTVRNDRTQDMVGCN